MLYGFIPQLRCFDDLIRRDEINVAYILKLLANLKGSNQEQRRKEIIDLIAGEAHLRSKRELIEKFIQENLPLVADVDDIPEAFDRFWNEEQINAFKTVLERKTVGDRILSKILRFVETFINGIAGS